MALALVAGAVANAQISVYDGALTGDGTYYGGNEEGGACQLAGVS